MRLILISYTLFMCLCCVTHSGDGDKIRNADRVDIYYRSRDEVLKYSDSSRKVINSFVEVLNGKAGKRKCGVMGEVRFLSKDSILFEAGFSINTGKEDCQYLMAGEKAWKLTYAAGMFLSESLNDRRKN